MEYGRPIICAKNTVIKKATKKASKKRNKAKCLCIKKVY